MNTPATPAESRYGKGLQFHYSHTALAVLVAGVVLAVAPARSAAIAIAGCAAIWIGLYIFMRESARTIRWFATPMIAVFGWFILISMSGSMAGWAPSGKATTVGTEPVQATTTGASLGAEVRLTGAEFLVTNRGDRPWTDVMLSVTGSDSATYTTRADRIDAGKTAVVQLSRFMASDGHPFRTATTKPQSLTIDARSNDQRGTYTVRWR